MRNFRPHHADARVAVLKIYFCLSNMAKRMIRLSADTLMDSRDKISDLVDESDRPNRTRLAFHRITQIVPFPSMVAEILRKLNH